MMKKISFEIAKTTLEKNLLLIKTISRSNEIPLGFPQNRVDQIQKGDIYIAFQGTQHDGHDFISKAIEMGAGCIVLENEKRIPSKYKIPCFIVSDSRSAWSVLCSLVYGNPEANLHLYGVTGTDGKTSTVWISSQLVRNASQKCLSLGTLGTFDGKDHWHLDHTTPDPPVLFSKFDHAVKNKIPNVIMEVSSHSLMQGKLQNLKFNAAIFTSFSRDHLDFHKTIEDYWAAKCLLFTRHLKDNGLAIVHYKLLEKFPILETKKLWTYGFDPHLTIQKENHVPILEVKPGKLGQFIRFKIQNKEFSGEIPYFGIHNAENFLAAFLLAKEISSYFPDSQSWMNLASIPGRCELIDPREDVPKVFVDFAHTPTGIRTILKTLREYTRGKLWIVFGCGGNRDSGKRPEMTREAELNADCLILTSDNPRNEDPDFILAEMKKGLSKNNSTLEIIDRERAIEHAISHAKKEDTILIAGKGHEAFQIIGTKKIPFSDQNIARHYLNLLWSKHT